MQTLYLKEEHFFKFLDILSKEHRVFLTQKTEGKKLSCDSGAQTSTYDYTLKEYSKDNKDEVVFSDYRTIEPIKAFFFPPKERVAHYFGALENIKDDERIALFGVKNCDLFSLKIQDFVFLEGAVKDSFYEKRRKNTLLISSDCPNFKEACFCAALDIMPYAQSGFDLNMSPLSMGFLVDVGSPRGKEVIEKAPSCFLPATDSQIVARRKKREAMLRKFNEHLAFHNIPSKEIIPKVVRAGHDSGIWKERALTCIECGGCNFICDTCHCFLLADEKSANTNERIRLWDACLYANFARVAGGANPMKYRYQRVRNRYLKKFDFFPANINLCACCGCGRCIEVCPAKIDIREVLSTLAKEDSAREQVEPQK